MAVVMLMMMMVVRRRERKECVCGGGGDVEWEGDMNLNFISWRERARSPLSLNILIVCQFII